MEVPNFASPKWVHMLKSFEKKLYRTRKYKTVVGGAILNYSSILKLWKKVTSTIFFLWFDVSKSKIFNDLHENGLNYGTFVSGGHLEFLHHFQVLFWWSSLPKYVIRSTLKLISHETCGVCYPVPLANYFDVEILPECNVVMLQSSTFVHW
jgi:hypothetical protein